MSPADACVCRSLRPAALTRPATRAISRKCRRASSVAFRQATRSSSRFAGERSRRHARSSAAGTSRPASSKPQSVQANVSVAGFALAIRQATSAASPSCTSRPANGNTNACQPSRPCQRSTSSVSRSGSRLQRACVSSSGSTAATSRGAGRPPPGLAASRTRSSTASERSVERGMRPPFHRGTCSPAGPRARFTQAVRPSNRKSTSGRPANRKRSPGASRDTNDSSTVPSDPPRSHFTCTVASPAIVPMFRRWRRAMARLVTYQRPNRSVIRAWSGYAASAGPPRAAKSSAHRHDASSMPAKACVDSTSARSSVARNPPLHATVTRCCARQSSAPVSGRRASTTPASTEPRAAAHSTSSSAWVGTQTSRPVAPGAWPLRPARWRSRAIPFGLPTCRTCSTGPKSTPRSRLDVATTHFSVPLRSPASARLRRSRSTDP